MFVAIAIREKLELLERQRLESELEKGYKEMAEEHSRIVQVAHQDQSRVALRGR